jgi:hypothetical protein
VAVLDQRPHVRSGPGPLPGDLASLQVTDLIQGPPQRRIRGHRPIELTLISQRRQVREHPATVGDQHRRIRQHPTSIMHRHEPTASQRPRQATGQARAIGYQT